MITSLGIKCSKDKIDWAVVEVRDAEPPTLVDHASNRAPSGDRGAQLTWFRQEVLEKLSRFQPDLVALRVIEPMAQRSSHPRAECEGVVQEAVASADLLCIRVTSASLRGAFGVKNGKELEQAIAAEEVIEGIPKTRQEPIVAAIAALRRGRSL